jgi:uncharacterized damage-inducible protein DinB
MKKGIRMALVISLAPAALAAQAPGPSVQQQLWHNVTTNITRAAEEMPEANYAFQPTPEVRTFGQLVGHLAGAQYMMCAASLGEPARAEDDIEKSRKTKAALVEALKASTAYCERAYTQTDSALAGSTQLFGQEVSRMYALSLNTVHNGEHYGNMVTYLRIKGMVPPSSRRGP